METESTKLCRACGKSNHAFCQINHEVIRKFCKLAPACEIDAVDLTLPPDICVECYQNIKKLVFTIESISDMQKILKMRNGEQFSAKAISPPSLSIIPIAGKKRSFVEDLQKNKNIQIKKVCIATVEKVPAQPLALKKPLVLELKKTPEAKEIVPKNEVLETSFSQKRWMCTTCTHKCTDLSQLHAHINCKQQSEAHKFTCHCSMVFDTRPAFLLHLDTAHRQNKGVCNICKKIFPSNPHLQNHMQAVHKSPTKKVYTNEAAKLPQTSIKHQGISSTPMKTFIKKKVNEA